MEKPETFFWSVLGGDELALLNYSATSATVRLNGGEAVRMEPFSIVLRTAP
jgi:hypothetical protein